MQYWIYIRKRLPDHMDSPLRYTGCGGGKGIKDDVLRVFP